MGWKNQLTKTPILMLVFALVSIQLIMSPTHAFADFVFSIPPEIGPSSSDDGKFDLPEDVTVDSDGNIYVSDAGNFRIQKFNSTGNFQLKFGSTGMGPSQFNNPFGIAVNSLKEIYVVDPGNNRVQKFNSEGGFLSEFGTVGFNDSEFFIPFGIGIDSSDNTYVLDSGNGRIQKFNSADVFQGWLGGCTSGANCDVINQHSNGFLCTTNTCSVSAGSGEGQFTLPQGIDFDSSGNIYVTEITTNRVQKFDSGGNFVLMFGWGVDSGANEFEICTDTCQQGMPGSGDGQFNIPTDIAIDSFDNVHVVDNVNDRIQKFNSEGSFLSKFGLSSSAEGDFNGPRGITIDSFDDMFIADRGNNRIQKFSDLSCNIPISGDWIVTQDCEIFVDESTPASVIIQNSSVVTVNSEGSLTVPAGENIIIVAGSGLKLVQGSNLHLLS